MNVSSELDRWLPPGTSELLTRIGVRAAELGYRACLVGGAVRDLLLGRAILDLDVVVEGDASAVARAAVMPGEPEPVVHASFGTATIRSGVFHVDLASTRAESYERPGALPAVRPGSLEQDLARRDFALNAMAVTLDGHSRGDLLDPYGGLRDLEHGLLRVLHENSFIDDATRILRGVRYEQRFGFAFEERTLALLGRDIGYLSRISADRVRHEMERTLAEDEPEQALARMDSLGVLGAVHPALEFGRRKFWALARARKGRLSSAQLQTVSWCLLAWGVPTDELGSLVSRLNPTRQVRGALVDTVRLSLLETRLDNPALKPGEVYDLLHACSQSALVAAELLFSLPGARANTTLYLRRLRHVRPLLTGRDLQALGVPEGPQLGLILSALRTARMNEEVSSREDEAALALRLSAGAGQSR